MCDNLLHHLQHALPLRGLEPLPLLLRFEFGRLGFHQIPRRQRKPGRRQPELARLPAAGLTKLRVRRVLRRPQRLGDGDAQRCPRALLQATEHVSLPLGVLDCLAVHGALHNQRRRRVDNWARHVVEFRRFAVGLRAALRGACDVLLDGSTSARANTGVAVAVHEVLCGNEHRRETTTTLSRGTWALWRPRRRLRGGAVS